MQRSLSTDLTPRIRISNEVYYLKPTLFPQEMNNCPTNRRIAGALISHDNKIQTTNGMLSSAPKNLHSQTPSLSEQLHAALAEVCRLKEQLRMANSNRDYNKRFVLKEERSQKDSPNSEIVALKNENNTLKAQIISFKNELYSQKKMNEKPQMESPPASRKRLAELTEETAQLRLSLQHKSRQLEKCQILLQQCTKEREDLFSIIEEKDEIIERLLASVGGSGLERFPSSAPLLVGSALSNKSYRNTSPESSAKLNDASTIS